MKLAFRCLKEAELDHAHAYNYFVLTGLMPVNMPTYPAKLVDLKTVALFRLKSTLTARGLSLSVIIQEWFL